MITLPEIIERDKIIVHVIARDKFTAGYINFMKLRMTEWEHHFFVAASGIYDVKPVDERNVHYYSKSREIAKKYRDLLTECRKIIISGVWDTRLLLSLQKDFVHKTYLQFWGGDFYGYRFSRIPGIRHPRASLKWLIRRYLHHRFIKHCAGTLSLITRDIDELQKIFPSNVKHFTARMPEDVLEHHDFTSLASRRHESSTVRILAGNSAQRPNDHKGIFESLEHLKDSDIEIVSPLSYGEPDYRNKVIALGHKIFGDKFKPITDFIPKAEYVEFLASCDCAVFNYNQQAALGNIWLMFRLGKKVWLRENSSMWHDFTAKGAAIYPISELSCVDFEALSAIPDDARNTNIALAEERFSGQDARKEWEAVLND